MAKRQYSESYNNEDRPNDDDEKDDSDDDAVYYDKIVQCSLCKVKCEQPKQLPCRDIICLKCLKQYFKDTADGERISCPMCSRQLYLPPGGVEAFGGLEQVGM